LDTHRMANQDGFLEFEFIDYSVQIRAHAID
jgi:hypothetical protein